METDKRKIYEHIEEQENKNESWTLNGKDKLHIISHNIIESVLKYFVVLYDTLVIPS